MKRQLIACAVAMLLGTVGANADPLNIRISWVAVPNNLPPLFMAKPEMMQHAGKSYTVDPIRFPGTPQSVAALASGDLDIATLAPSSFALAIENAHMSDLRVIGDENQDGVPGWFTSLYFVLKDSPIKSVEDLKGKVLASNAIGGGLDIGIRAMLRKHHLDDKRDANIIEGGFPTLLPMLREHKADLVAAVPPFSFIGESAGDVRTLFTLRDAIGTSEFIFDVTRKLFIDKNRAALVDFTEDWIRAERWYLDPKNHDEAVKIVAEFTKVPAKSWTDWVFTHKDVYRDPDHRANIKALQATLDIQQQLGIQKTHIDVAKYADQSLVDDAVKRIR